MAHQDDTSITATERWQWRRGEKPEKKRDLLAVEEPLEIRVRGRSISVTMRTPGHDDELAAGFLLTEGLIHQPGNIVHIEPCARAGEGNILNVFLAADVAVDMARLTRHVFASSSCGVCGKASIESVWANFPPLKNVGPTVAAETLLTFPDRLREAQKAFEQTGGLHAAALFDASGEMVVLREDVGRHNAVDKVLGHALLTGLLPLEQHVMMVSGRSSFEIMQKALAAGVPIVAAVSAPSSLAVAFADESNMTLVGFLRGEGMNIYTHPARIIFV
ncbi:MAG: formate dehydrogenase accessory sulfurtransferase FdhD [Phycisphaeraceae bacterium]